MEQTNGKDGSSQLSEERQNGQLKTRVGSLGTLPDPSAKYAPYEVGTSREDCNEGDTVVRGEQPSTKIGGKLIRQLVSETEKQLAYHEEQSEYHKQQAELLKQRLEELKQIPESPINTNTVA